jgi:uncharacterized repeat protein (TIGR03803 family)
VQATNGNFYGTTVAGGTSSDCNGVLGCGTVFEITTSGQLTTLHSFGGTDGEKPYAGLVQGTNVQFYGTTSAGGRRRPVCGTLGCGTIFEITAEGQLTTIHRFHDVGDGFGPVAGLVQATNGNFYGTTEDGPITNTEDDGTVFEITPGGKLTTLHRFTPLNFGENNGYGYFPKAGLVQATNGKFYGTTWDDVFDSFGTIFRITSQGKLTKLHRFLGSDGDNPVAALVQATNGELYGTTTSQGTHAFGTVFVLDVGLGPFIESLPTSGAVGAVVIILGTNLTGATSVTFNGKPTTFTVVSSSEITTTVPSEATTGPVKVKTPSGTLTSNVSFRVS